MNSAKTQRAIESHLLKVFGGYAFRATQPGFRDNRTYEPPNKIDLPEGRRTFRMCSDPITGRIWYEAVNGAETRQ